MDQRMNLCATCKHWTPLSAERVINASPDVPDEERWGVCTMGSGGCNKPNKVETLVFAIDCSAYEANLITRDDFGCVMHQEKT